MKIDFLTIERKADSTFEKVVLAFIEEERTVVRCLNTDELAMLNDPKKQEYNLDYFSLKFANECTENKVVTPESSAPIELERDVFSKQLIKAKI